MDAETKKPASKERGKYIIKRLSAFMLAAAVIGGGAAAAAARELIPVGRAVGIRLESDGVVIAGIPDMCADGITPSPAKNSGLKAGDIIVNAGGAEITSGEDLKALMSNHKGEPIAIQVKRGDKLEQMAVTPQKTREEMYSLGILVRDGVSGIGTITFYDPETGAYGALGHPVNDGETGVTMPVREGFISHMSLSDVAKGRTGVPGQLHGSVDFDNRVGTVIANTDCGIFGEMQNTKLLCEKPIEAAKDSEIHTGKAHILSNVNGSSVKRYNIEVSRVFTGGEADGRSMLITITDEALKEATGGIVQGMSGSPIIQNNKLIGAVTHVLINEPTKGYGISISKMLENAEGIEDEIQENALSIAA